MTEAEKKMKKYVNAVERRLHLPWEVKVRVMSDFQSSISARREAGEDDGAIFAALGTPKEAAAELNEQMKEYAWRKSPWRFACLGISVLAGLWLGFYGLVHLLAVSFAASMGSGASLGIIGGADGPTSVFVTSRLGFDWDLVIVAAILVLGLWGYWRLCRCKK